MDERFSAWLGVGVMAISLGLFFYTQTPEDDPLAVGGPVERMADRRLPQQAPAADMPMQSPEPPPARQWGRYEQGQLQPSVDLRARFDQLLAQRGEESLSAVRSRVQAMATQDLGVDGGRAVTQVWDRYLALLTQDEAVQSNWPAQTDTPEQWIASRLNFFTQARTSLGPVWGNVFFAEDEAQVRQLAQNMAQQRLHAAQWQAP